MVGRVHIALLLGPQRKVERRFNNGFLIERLLGRLRSEFDLRGTFCGSQYIQLFETNLHIYRSYFL